MEWSNKNENSSKSGMWNSPTKCVCSRAEQPTRMALTPNHPVKSFFSWWSQPKMKDAQREKTQCSPTSSSSWRYQTSLSTMCHTRCCGAPVGLVGKAPMSLGIIGGPYRATVLFESQDTQAWSNRRAESRRNPAVEAARSQGLKNSCLLKQG
jgi:hypothetical protein